MSRSDTRVYPTGVASNSCNTFVLCDNSLLNFLILLDRDANGLLCKITLRYVMRHVTSSSALATPKQGHVTTDRGSVDMFMCVHAYASG